MPAIGHTETPYVVMTGGPPSPSQMSKVELGGATVFPLVGARIPPTEVSHGRQSLCQLFMKLMPVSAVLMTSVHSLLPLPG